MILGVRVSVMISGVGQRGGWRGRVTDRSSSHAAQNAELTFGAFCPPLPQAGLKQPLQRIGHNTKYGECWLCSTVSDVGLFVQKQ